jgi:nicotinamide-nucleotide amidase
MMRENSDQVPALVERIGTRLRDAQQTLALAESCTGGIIGGLITDRPGASVFFRGGVICYANEVKIGLLAVRPETLARHGAVSEETAREMAAGARQKLGADYGLAVTGIAGPEGGTPDKPIGTVWLAVDAHYGSATHLLALRGDRAHIRAAAAQEALSFLADFLIQ